MPRKRLTLLCAGVFVLFVFTALPAEVLGQVEGKPNRQVTDQAISDHIEDELLIDQAVPGHRINVETENGIVTLTGTVSNILAKERAARIGETVKGVRSVINQVKVDPLATRSDEAIEQDVRAALASDPAVESYEVRATVLDGLLTLTGTVDSWQERELAAKVAKGVRGVTGLVNDVTVESDVERPDQEIESEIEQALRWDILVDDAMIGVSVDDGVVELSGTVGSAAEKRLATQEAWVTGVETVDADDLSVARWARDDELRQNKYPLRSAEEIREAIEAALQRDPRVDADAVDPVVFGSVVTLRGRVEDLRAKRTAGQVARRTVGVTNVGNRLKVRFGDARDPAEVETSIERALENNPYTERYEITVAVVDGTAYLYGTVDSYFEKAEAEDLASRVYGVSEVESRLDVEDVYDPYVYDPYVDYGWGRYGYDGEIYDGYEIGFTAETDAEIREEIEDELFWSPYVDSDEIEVAVDDGVATLAGTVETYLEREKAAENAWEGGATWVDNDIEVR